MEAVVDHRGKIFCNARHPPRPDRLDARLLDGIKDRARRLARWHELAMNVWIVTSELERNRIGMSAHDRGFAQGKPAGWFRQADLAADDAGPLGREGDFQVGFTRDRANAACHRPLERFGRILLLTGALGLLVRHLSISSTPR